MKKKKEHEAVQKACNHLSSAILRLKEAGYFEAAQEVDKIRQQVEDTWARRERE